MKLDSIKKWLRDLVTVLKKDLISTKRVKKYLFAALIPPLVLLIVFTIFMQIGNPETYTVVLVDEDKTDESQLMVEYISNISSDFARWFTVINIDSYEEAKHKLDSYEILGLIYIPTGFKANLTSEDPNIKTYIILIVQNINEDYVKNYIQRLDEAVLTFNQESHLSLGHVDNFALIAKKCNYIDQDISSIRGIVVGVLSMYGIICGLCYGSLNIAKEYENQTILEIINSPISHTAFIASKQLIGVIIGAIITSIIGLFLYWVFQIKFSGNFLIVFLAYILSTWTHACIGCLIGLKFKRIMPVILISIICSFLLWFFSGGLAPLRILGNFVILISKIFPSTYWGEILFAETFIPHYFYTMSRFLILLIMSFVITAISWYIIKKESFKF